MHMGWWYVLALGLVQVVLLVWLRWSLRVHRVVWRVDRCMPELVRWCILRRWYVVLVCVAVVMGVDQLCVVPRQG